MIFGKTIDVLLYSQGLTKFCALKLYYSLPFCISLIIIFHKNLFMLTILFHN